MWRLLATVMCLGVHGCTEATGGAVELSWALRTTTDTRIECAEGRIAKIRLNWATPDTLRSTSFLCKDNHGVTAFDLPVVEPERTVALSVTPECNDGKPADPASYITPPPIVRQVSVGETITLDAVLLVVRIANCDPVNAPCVCP